MVMGRIPWVNHAEVADPSPKSPIPTLATRSGNTRPVEVDRQEPQVRFWEITYSSRETPFLSSRRVTRFGPTYGAAVLRFPGLAAICCGCDRVVLERDPETGDYSAVCPVLPGCTSAGETEEEARADIREAIALLSGARGDRCAGECEALRGDSRVSAGRRGSLADQVIRIFRSNGFLAGRRFREPSEGAASSHGQTGNCRRSSWPGSSAPNHEMRHLKAVASRRALRNG